MTSQPLFILGAPRSGTTFLCWALNRHPLIGLTSESRIFLLMKELIEAQSIRPHLLEPVYRDRFQRFARRHAGEWIERFYREELEIATPIWGDKHPSYGDPAVLSGREDATIAEPRSGSCLRLIRECLPDARYIHLHRHPWQVAASMKRRGWVGSKSIGVQIWRQYVEEIDAFLAELEPSRHLSLSYADLVRHPDQVAQKVGDFLGLGVTAPIARFLKAQRACPTPFSSPTTDLRQPLDMPPPSPRGRMVLQGVADTAWRLGYAE